MKINLNANLNKKDLEKLKQAISNMDKVCKEATASTLDKGIASANAKLTEKFMEEQQFTNLSDRLSSVKTEKIDNNNYKIYSNDKVVIFNEYGTGVRAGNRASGWWYKASIEDKNTTKYRTKSGDYLAYTTGLRPMRMFEETKEELDKEFKDILQTEVKMKMEKYYGSK